MNRSADLSGAASPGEIVFTSGGTESDNWAIFGALEAIPPSENISSRHASSTRRSGKSAKDWNERDIA